MSAASERTKHALTLAGRFRIDDGYGSMTEYAALGIEKIGVPVNLLPLDLKKAGLSPVTLKMLRGSSDAITPPVVYYWYPTPELEQIAKYEHVIYTMFESTLLPASWPKILDRARSLIAPTSYVADTFRRSGVTVPIEIVPDGVDPDVYFPVTREGRDLFTVLVVGPTQPRKHVPQAIEAFTLAFGNDPSTRLIIKARNGIYGTRGFQSHDHRITVEDGNDTSRGILEWYRRADALLALGSEGFGLPLIEALATGLPAIALDSEGQSEICRSLGEGVLRVPPASIEVVDEDGYGYCGTRGVPDVGVAAQHLRWVREHRAEAAQRAANASEWIRRERTVWRKGPAIMDVVAGHCSTYQLRQIVGGE